MSCQEWEESIALLVDGDTAAEGRVRSRVRKSLLDLYAGREIGNQLRFQQGIQQESV